MQALLDHLTIVPIVLPMLAGGIMLLFGERRTTVKAVINLAATVALLVVAVALLQRSAGGAVSVAVYLPANWPAPFGIALAVDRLSAAMLVLTAIMSTAALLFSLARWHRAGVHFHPLFQFQLMGLNGAFLTADLFNLFVFFEVLLAASYGLLLHGSGPERVKASLHYVVVNLLGSSLFLIGVSMIYGVTGSLNMADVAVRITQLEGGDHLLLQTGAAILGVAFLLKAGAWPLNFWLPRSYAAASAPVGALFSVMTKMGVYIILRLSLLLFGDEAGSSAGFGSSWILYIGLATLTFGGLGMLSSRNLPRVVGFSVVVSSGTVLAAIGLRSPAVTASALFYLFNSTLAIGAFYLLLELVERSRTIGSDLLALTREAFGIETPVSDEPDEPTDVGVAIPAAMAFLGLSFIACALLLTGLPPMSGFIAKFALLTAMFNPDGLTPDVGGGLPASVWVMTALLIGSGLTGVIALTRVGVRTFWAPSGRTEPRLRVIEVLPITGLLAVCVALTFQAGPAMRYFDATARALHDPHEYIHTVLSTQRLASPAKEAKP